MFTHMHTYIYTDTHKMLAKLFNSSQGVILVFRHNLNVKLPMCVDGIPAIIHCISWTICKVYIFLDLYWTYLCSYEDHRWNLPAIYFDIKNITIIWKKSKFSYVLGDLAIRMIYMRWNIWYIWLYGV